MPPITTNNDRRTVGTPTAIDPSPNSPYEATLPSSSGTRPSLTPTSSVLTALEASERIDLNDANRVLRQIEGLGEGLLRTIESCSTGRDLTPSQRRQFQDKLLRYQNLTREFKEITGHEIQLGMAIDTDPAQLRAYVEEQHRLARAALSPAERSGPAVSTVSTPSSSVDPAPVTNLDWVNGEGMQVLTQAYPEISPLFRSESRATNQSRYVSELFRSGRFRELGISRSNLTPNKVVIGTSDSNDTPHILNVEEQIQNALDPEIRQAALARKLADPLNRNELNPDLRRMEHVVNRFGTEEERAKLREYRSNEDSAYHQVRDSAHNERQAQIDARRAQQEQQRHAEWLEDQVNYLERSGRGSNNPARASLLLNEEVRAAYTERLYQTSRQGRARLGAEAQVRSQRLAEDARSVAGSAQFARDLEATWRSLGYEVDMSDRIEQLEVQQVVLARASELQGVIAENPGTAASRAAQRDLDGLSPIIAQIRNNQRELDPSQEQPVVREDLSPDLQRDVTDGVIQNNRATLAGFYKEIKDQRTELDELIELHYTICRPDFDPTNFDLQGFTDLEEYKSNLDQEIQQLQNQSIYSNLFGNMGMRDLQASQQNIAAAMRQYPRDEILIRMQRALEQELASRSETREAMPFG